MFRAVCVWLGPASLFCLALQSAERKSPSSVARYSLLLRPSSSPVGPANTAHRHHKQHQEHEQVQWSTEGGEDTEVSLCVAGGSGECGTCGVGVAIGDVHPTQAELAYPLRPLQLQAEERRPRVLDVLHIQRTRQDMGEKQLNPQAFSPSRLPHRRGDEIQTLWPVFD